MGAALAALNDGIQRKRKKRTRAAVKKGSRGLRSRFVLVFSSRAVCRDLRLFGDRRAGCLILDCSIHPLFLMYSAVDASSRASGASKTTNKTPRLPSAVSGGNKAPWRLGTPYGAKSAPPREWYPTSVPWELVQTSTRSGASAMPTTPDSPHTRRVASRMGEFTENENWS